MVASLQEWKFLTRVAISYIADNEPSGSNFHPGDY